MDAVHRLVLQKHTPDIIKSLIVTEAILGHFYNTGVFDEEMIDMIRAEDQQSSKVCKVLALLKKRGPDAFEAFCQVIQEQCPWLTKQLQDSLETEQENSDNSQVKTSEYIRESTSADSIQCCCKNLEEDEDIKLSVSCFIMKKFGQVRRISNADKRTIENMMTKWMRAQRKHLRKELSKKIAAKSQKQDIETENVEANDLKEKIASMLDLIQTRQKQATWLPPQLVRDTTHNASSKDEESNDVEEELEESINELEDEQTSDIDLLQDEVRKLLDKSEYMESQIGRCFSYTAARLGKTRKREISEVVLELCEELHMKDKELRQERQKVEKMLVELYNMSTKATNSQQTLSLKEMEKNSLNEEINEVRRQNLCLIKEIADLERKNNVHLEKEKTLEDLRKTKEDLQIMMQVVNRENKELKERLHKDQSLALKNSQKGRTTKRPTGNAATIATKMSRKPAAKRKNKPENKD